MVSCEVLYRLFIVFLTWLTINGLECGLLKNQTLVKRKWQLYKWSEGIHEIGSLWRVQSVIELTLYWKRRSAFIFIENPTDFENKYLEAQSVKGQFQHFSYRVWNKTLDIDVVLQQESEVHVNYIIIGGQGFVHHLLKKGFSENLFKDANSWIVGGKHDLNAILKSVMKTSNAQVTLSSLDLTAKEDSSDVVQTVDFYDVFYSNSSSKIEQVHFGQWSLIKRLVIFEEVVEKERDRMWRGRHIRNFAFTHLPYIKTISETKPPYFVGPYVQILDEVVTGYFNASMSTRPMAEEFGTMINFCSSTGIVGVLFRKESDITYMGLAANAARFRGVKFMGPLLPLHMGISYRLPDFQVAPNSLVLPFSFTVWSLIVVFALIIVGLFATFLYWSPQFRWSNTMQATNHSIQFRLITGTFLDEVLNDPPSASSAVVYATLLVVTLMTFTFYNSILTSFLSYQNRVLPIKDFGDLIAPNKYTVVLPKGTSQYEIVTKSERGVVKRLRDKILAPHSSAIFGISICGAVSRLIEEPLVLIMDITSSISCAPEPCRLVVLPTPHQKEFMYSVARLDFPFNRMLYIRLLRLSETGIIRHLKNRWSTNIKTMCQYDNSASSSLGLDQVVLLFYLLGSGMALAILVFTIENIIYFKHKYNVSYFLKHRIRLRSR